MENTNYSNVNKAKIILTSIITGIINILIVIAMPMLSADFVLGPWTNDNCFINRCKHDFMAHFYQNPDEVFYHNLWNRSSSFKRTYVLWSCILPSGS